MQKRKMLKLGTVIVGVVLLSFVALYYFNDRRMDLMDEQSQARNKIILNEIRALKAGQEVK